jgi:hypothetical protein
VPIYSSFKYNPQVNGGQQYGQLTVSPLNSNPVTSECIEYELVKITWNIPSGASNAFRLVRNQEYFSETQDDGVILYEEYSLIPSINSFIDGLDNFYLYPTDFNQVSLIPGKFAFYTLWSRSSSSNNWIITGQTFTLIPKNYKSIVVSHAVSASATPQSVNELSGLIDRVQPGIQAISTQDKLMESIPKVFTTSGQSSLEPIDTTSTLYKFLKGFSLTYDEFMTYMDFIAPNYEQKNINPFSINAAELSLGLPVENTLPFKNRKALIREAVYIYQRKGTYTALQTYIESLTGYLTTLSDSPNLMLTNQDSTFNKSIGFWEAIGNIGINIENSVVTPTIVSFPSDVSLAVDLQYCGKVTVKTSNTYIKNGASSPKTKGIPVAGSTAYNFSFFHKNSTTPSGNTIQLSIEWYDQYGVIIGSAVTGTAVSSLATGWTRSNSSFTSPSNAVFCVVGFKFLVTGTFYLDMIQVSNGASLQPFNEANGIIITLLGNKNNFLYNPSFELNTNSWNGYKINSSGATTSVSISNAAVDTTLGQAISGTKMLTVTCDASPTTYATRVQTSISNVLPTQTYTFSIYGRSVTNVSYNSIYFSISSQSTVLTKQKINNIVTVRFLNPHPFKIGDNISIQSFGSGYSTTATVATAASNSLTYVDNTASSTIAATTGGTVSATWTTIDTLNGTRKFTNIWSRQFSSITTPENIDPANTTITVGVSTLLNNPTSASQVLYFDMAQMEYGNFPTDYFDGTIASTYGGVWTTGVAGNSPSMLYTTRDIKLSRLNANLKDQLPANTPYVIKLVSGVYSKGIV